MKDYEIKVNEDMKETVSIEAKDALNNLRKEHDQNWDKIMKLAEESGFILSAAAGTAIVATNRVQIEQLGYKGYYNRQKVCSALSEEVREHSKELEKEEEE